MALGQIYWNVDPIIFQLGPLAFRWYGLLFGAAFITGLYMMEWIYARENKSLDGLQTLFVYMVVGTIAGARLGHVLFYDPGYYLSQPLEIIKVWRGGLASHGGALGIFTAVYLYARRRPDQNYLWLLDRLVIPTALGGFFIRLGNLFNSEILGTTTDAPWGFIFRRIDDVARHPAQVYEGLGYFLIFLLLLTLYKRRASRNGLLLGTFLALVFLYRFAIEFVKQDQAAFAAVLPLSMGQLLSIPMILAGAILLVGAIRPSSNTSVLRGIDMKKRNRKRFRWVAGGLLALAAAMVLIQNATTGKPTRESPAAAIRTVVVMIDGERGRHEENVVPVTLVEGKMPVRSGLGRVETDDDCAPDADGISHCLNRIAVGQSRFTVRHDHEMATEPCLRPGEIVRVARLS